MITSGEILICIMNHQRVPGEYYRCSSPDCVALESDWDGLRSNDEGLTMRFWVEWQFKEKSAVVKDLVQELCI